jgi:transcription-repair coupling factor (superfamily II helicase)
VADFPNDKAIIMTERIACVEEIYVSLSESIGEDMVVLHHGKMSEGMRKAALRSFSEMESDSPRVLVSTRPSIDVGINLQVANRVIFNDLPWTPADIAQAAARIKRLNQQKEVFEYWIVCDTPFDRNLQTNLKRKLALIKAYAEGKNISEAEQKWMNERVTFKDIYYGRSSPREDEVRDAVVG